MFAHRHLGKCFHISLKIFAKLIAFDMIYFHFVCT